MALWRKSDFSSYRRGWSQNLSNDPTLEDEEVQLFNYHLIEELSLLAKFCFAIHFQNAKGVAAGIQRLNSMRNGLAHAFFPENLNEELRRG